MASSSRRSDYGEEFVEQLRRNRFKKAYILVNGVSSEEEDEELEFDDEDDEMASYAMGPTPNHPPRPSSTSSRRPPSIAASYSQRAIGIGAYGFDARDLYFFGVVSELTDKFTPERTTRLIARNPPPPEYRTFASVERIAYLLYYSLYGRYLNVTKFHNIFNREFYKYTSAGDTERNAFLKICRHTLEEYKRRIIEQNKRAYKMTQKHLFSDERATPDSRASDRPSVCAEESLDRESLESLPKELVFYRAPHTPIRFAAGGRIIYVNPDAGMSLVCIEDTKKYYKDSQARRYVEMLESFKGPMLYGHTPPQTPLLFIQRQIDRILQSDVYRANHTSGDANDCLLIWHLLDMLVRQQGKVTGPDLARLLCSNNHYSSYTYQNFLITSNSYIQGSPETLRQNSSESIREADSQAMDRVTRFLLGGHIEEAIESAINDGLLFDALLLAHRLFRNDQRRLEGIEARLLAHRSAQHPITTLVSVAADLPVPLLNNPTTDDTNGWRAHIAIVLANLHTQTAINAVYHLGLALAQKEFNSAADFCFLAVNLLTGYNCFQPPIANELADGQSKYRKHIHLISASLPDDEFNSCTTRFGWSLLDYQATEIYDYALQLGNSGSQTVLSKSNEYQLTRKQYSHLLDELGGFGYAVELYNNSNGELQGCPPRTPSPPRQLQAHRQTIAPITHSQPPPQQQKPIMTPPAHQHQQIQSPIQPLTPPTHQHFQQQQQQMMAREQQTQSAIDNLPHQESEAGSRSPSPQQQQAEQTFGQVAYFLPPIPPQIQQPAMPPLDHHQVRTAPDSILQDSSESSSSSPSPPPPKYTNMPKHQHTTQNSNQQAQHQITAPFPITYSQPSPAHQQIQQSMPTKDQPSAADDKAIDGKEASTGTGGGSGFLKGRISGLFSKIKPQGQKEMKLPDDKNPKIVWDPQLGKYVDQQQKDKPVEELPPPPIFPSHQKAPENRQETLTPIPVDDHQPTMSPPQVPDIFTVPPIPKSSGSSSRPLQGRARYANAFH